MAKETAADSSRKEEHVQPEAAVPAQELPAEVFEEDAIRKLILGTAINKYDVILQARRWANDMKHKNERHRSVQELIAKSLNDVLTGKVTRQTIRDLPPIVIAKKPKGPPTTAILDNIGKSSEQDDAEPAAEKSKSSSKKKKS